VLALSFGFWAVGMALQGIADALILLVAVSLLHIGLTCFQVSRNVQHALLLPLLMLLMRNSGQTTPCCSRALHCRPLWA
jgi:hypothetical protein